MRMITDFNDGWLFDGQLTVRLPHTAVELPFSYFDETAYQRVFTYEKTIVADPGWAGREVSLVFDGAMANAKVWLNGVEIAAHADGYTPFQARLTGLLQPGANRIAVEIDGSENPGIPPFGGAIDYLTYAGIYREVWLKVTAPVSLGLTKIETPDVLAATKTVTARVQIDNPQNLPLSGNLTATLRDAEGLALATATAAVTVAEVSLRFSGLTGITLWDLDTPALYTLHLQLDMQDHRDATAHRFGFRAAEFTAAGFLLNGRPLKIRGLNRHQSFPYAGYALGKAAQVLVLVFLLVLLALFERLQLRLVEHLRDVERGPVGHELRDRASNLNRQHSQLVKEVLVLLPFLAGEHWIFSPTVFGVEDMLARQVAGE